MSLFNPSPLGGQTNKGPTDGQAAGVEGGQTPTGQTGEGPKSDGAMISALSGTPPAPTSSAPLPAQDQTKTIVDPPAMITMSLPTAGGSTPAPNPVVSSVPSVPAMPEQSAMAPTQAQTAAVSAGAQPESATPAGPFGTAPNSASQLASLFQSGSGFGGMGAGNSGIAQLIKLLQGGQPA